MEAGRPAAGTPILTGCPKGLARTTKGDVNSLGREILSIVGANSRKRHGVLVHVWRLCVVVLLAHVPVESLAIPPQQMLPFIERLKQSNAQDQHSELTSSQTCLTVIVKDAQSVTMYCASCIPPDEVPYLLEEFLKE